MNQEREVIQIVKRGTPDMIPRIPSMLDMMTFKINKPKINAKVYKGGCRNDLNGDGVCAKCLKPKKSAEFATPTGFVCKSCKAQGFYRSDAKKRPARRAKKQ